MQASIDAIFMKHLLIRIRNAILHALYRLLLKPLFFARDPEAVHDRMIRAGVRLGRHGITRALTRLFFGYRNPLLRQTILGISFENPIGLSAGFDKNGELADILPSVGFGFAELGSITGEKCEGNSGQRLWRLPRSKSLVVYYGLKNDGCEAIAKRLSGKKFAIPMGMSVAMTNCAENADVRSGIADFAKAFKVMEPIGAYITVNVSCPNTQNGQPFLDAKNMGALFDELDAIPTGKPIFIKLSPDLPREQVDAILEVAKAHRIHGIICTNLTKKRDNPRIAETDVPSVGGISGKAVQDLSDDLLSYVYRKEGQRFVLIGSGGIFSAEDAYRKIRLGASLVQLITGMVFEGPQLISEINRALAVLLRKDGFISITEAIGADHRNQ